MTQWSAHLLGEHLRGQGLALSDTSVARILKHADLRPHRQQMWLTSQDDEFRAKRDDALRVYYETPRRLTTSPRRRKRRPSPPVPPC